MNATSNGSQDQVTADDRRGLRAARAAFVAVAVAGLLIVGGPAAATGVLPSGTSVESGSDPGSGHVHGNHADRTVLARGASPVAGPWRLTAVRTTADGNSPPGDCLQLLLTEPPPGTPMSATVLCQNVGETEFKAASVPVVNPLTGEAETLLFGAVPGAGTVQLDADDGTTVAANATPLPPGSSFPARPWVMAVPSGPRTGDLHSTDENGRQQRTIDASRYLDQLSIWRRNLITAR